jgi:hypothetical protein
MKRFVSFAFCFAAMAFGAAADADFLGGGRGNNSCGQFIASMGKRPPGMMRSIRTPAGDLLMSENAAYLQRLLGFVSGVDATREEQQQVQVSQLAPAGLDLWMRNWCNKHPTQPIVEAAQLFINEMLTNAAAARR